MGTDQIITGVKMKIAFTSKGTDWDAQIDPRFGRTEFIVVFDEEKEILTHFDNRDVNEVAHGAGPKTAQKLFDLSPDILITGNGPGGNANRVLKESGLKIYTGAGEYTLKSAYEAFKNGKLTEF